MPTDRAATPDVLEALHRDGLLPAPAFDRALALSCASPGAQRWRRFLDWLLLGMGAALLLVGLILFVAFNWSALPALVKLGLIAGLVAGAAYGAWRLGLDALPGRIALTGAAVMIGPLLAIYGQTYQTGADPWQLFLAWAGLAALWVGISRFPPLLLVELVLIDVTLVLFWDQVASSDVSWGHYDEPLITLVLAVVQGVAWVGWELGAWRKLSWLQARWLPRTLAVASLGLLGASCVRVVVGDHSDYEVSEYLGLLGLLGLMAAMAVFFTQVKRDLFMIAAALAAAMTLVTIWVGRLLFSSHFDIGEVFLLGLVVIAEVGAAAWLLRTLHRRWEAAR